MSEEEKKALEWIDKACTWSESTESANRHRATLKAMLAQPRMPEKATREALAAMRAADADVGPISIEEIYRALYDHLTKPKVKTVQVWHVRYSRLQNGEGYWAPLVEGGFTSQRSADVEAKRLANDSKNSCVSVTGPHEQEIPASPIKYAFAQVRRGAQRRHVHTPQERDTA